MRGIERVVAAGLATLCAVALGAILPSGALAVPTENNTAFTCVESEAGTGEFTDAHCATKGGTKAWKHVAIPVGESTQLTAAATSTWEFIVPLGGPEIIVKAPEVECLECMVENHEEEFNGKKWMDLQGTGRLRLSKVTTSLSSIGCVVANGGVVTSSPLKFTTTKAGKLLVEPVSGIALFTVEWATGCSFSKLPFDGFFNSTLTGATQKIETVKGEVDFGAEGHEAYLKAGATLSVGPTEGKVKVTHYPLSLTAS
jgi:hypothetical protein